MELDHLQAFRYRSLRDVDLPLARLSVFIGANASGKSNLLDALRFLAAGVSDKDFSTAVRDRGGPLALAWKGERASTIRLVASFHAEDVGYEWIVALHTRGFAFSVTEELTRRDAVGQTDALLSAESGSGWWWSEEAQRKVPIAQSETVCALAAASVDASFPGRAVADFVGTWNFFDPNPSLLRRTTRGEDDSRLDPFGRNLAARLHALHDAAPAQFEAIVTATRNVLGVPASLDLSESDDGRIYFRLHEPGLEFPVHQLGASSGTLRMLALMTGLLGESDAGLVGIEEPENHVHPSALDAFAEHILQAREHIQVLVTTHSPMLLDHLDDPGAVFVVRRGATGTEIAREDNPDAVRRALNESGFALGEFHQTKGFGV
jgi:predicted ATPase